MLSRYSDMNYLLGMGFEDFFELYIKGKEKETEERMFQMYCALLPNFNQETYMTFADFKKHNEKHPVQTVISDGGKTDDENIQFAESIIRMPLEERK